MCSAPRAMVRSLVERAASHNGPQVPARLMLRYCPGTLPWMIESEGKLARDLAGDDLDLDERVEEAEDEGVRLGPTRGGGPVAICRTRRRRRLESV